MVMMIRDGEAKTDVNVNTRVDKIIKAAMMRSRMLKRMTSPISMISRAHIFMRISFIFVSNGNLGRMVSK